MSISTVVITITNVTAGDYCFQTVAITTCASVEHLAGRRTLNGSIRKAYQRLSVQKVNVSMIECTVLHASKQQH